MTTTTIRALAIRFLKNPRTTQKGIIADLGLRMPKDREIPTADYATTVLARVREAGMIRQLEAHPAMSTYPPYEREHQEKEHARWMSWRRSDWLASLEDIIFEHEYMGRQAIEFYGDYRPTDVPAVKQEGADDA